ncbi:MAG TPA: hypothetical protein VL356_12595 [Acidocella sp.]|nr:hypothetical protein [Acidocella sp.]
MDKARSTNVSALVLRRSITEISSKALKGRVEQHGQMRHPVRAAVRGARFLIAREQGAELTAPGIFRQVRMVVAKQDDGAARLDHPVQPAQRFDPIHPMEGAAHGNELEAAQLRPQIVGTALPPLHIGRRRLTGEGEHFGFGVDAEHAADFGGKSRRQMTRAAAEIEQAMPGREPAEFGDVLDQPCGVRRAAGKVVVGGGAETVRLEDGGLG